jgi:hypothetical protein
MEDLKKFHYVNLAINFSNFTAKDPECNPGGSYVCTAGCTMPSCPPGSCAGASVKLEIMDPFNAKILVAEGELSKLKEELQKTILKFVEK